MMPPGDGAASPPPDAMEQTLTEFLIGEQRKRPGATGGFTALVSDVRLACKRISHLVGKGALAGGARGYAGTENVQGEAQTRLDVAADAIFRRTCEWGGTLAAMLSEESAEPYAIPVRYPQGDYLLAFDPLDGSSNIDANAPVGSIFSVLRDSERKFLQPGAQQVCAGYAIYGPTTMLVLTLGQGTHGFTLDREIGEFILTHPGLRIPEETGEFAINASNARFWEPAVGRYVQECLAGKSGPRGRDFNMRWIASLVADVHRILMRGGVYLYPRDARDATRHGRLRLLYEANPIAMVIEQAGGLASTGTQRVLEVEPRALHERCGLIFGAKQEVERLERYHREHNERAYDAPLFAARGLFRAESRA
jgi:fructose-1,6-bisphosphatase I/sedoheptulose-1,7-bisphosphatase